MAFTKEHARLLKELRGWAVKQGQAHGRRVREQALARAAALQAADPTPPRTHGEEPASERSSNEAGG
jgi:hypothetical protein